MLTLTEHIDMMKHALGKTPNSKHKLIGTFNRAGHALVNEHRWAWRARSPVALEIPANSDTAPLPEDFSECLEVLSTNSTVFSVRQTTVQDIMLKRSAIAYESLTLWIAFRVGPSQATPTSPSDRFPVAEVWPTQSAARNDVELHYLAGWREMDETSDAQIVPNIPATFEQALILKARAFALDLENQEVGREHQAYQEEISRLKQLDAGIQVNMGQPRHSVRAVGSFVYYPHKRVGPKT